MAGTITDEVQHKNRDVMPYDRIFIPDGQATTISGLSLTQKNALSQRGQAFRRLGEYLTTRERA
jgi:inosine/xanthosine triphosphate pyrophosphatase family protein